MRPVKEYIMVSANVSSEFIEKVNIYLNLGYELYGSPYSSVEDYNTFDNQAMVKYEDEKC